MDEKRDKEAWERAIAEFQAKYHSTAGAEPYWQALQFFRIGDVVAGLEAAALESPEEMPDVGTVANRVREIARGHLQEEPVEPDVRENPARAVQDPQTYVDAADGVYERFAREWEAASLGPVTREEKLQRIRKLNTSLAGKTGMS